MVSRNRSFIAPIILLALLAIPLLIVYAAGGSIEGKVVDPKGAAVTGATVTLSDDLNNQTFTAVSDANGHYKIESLPPGTYTVTISASGFGEGRKEAVKVGESATATVDFKLEIAAVEATVSVAAGQLKANTDPVYQTLRQQTRGDQDFVSYATVNNLMLKREGSTFSLKSGEVYFLAPVAGRYTGGVFIGDGEFNIQPPTEVEKSALKVFTNEASLTEQFSSLVLRFTDKTFDEIKNNPAAKLGNNGPQAGRARDMFRDNQTLLRNRLRENTELRILADLYAAERPGFYGLHKRPALQQTRLFFQSAGHSRSFPGRGIAF